MLKTERRAGARHKRRDAGGRIIRKAFVFLVLPAAFMAVSWLGWRWVRSLPVSEVRVEAPPVIRASEILTAASVDTTAYLFEIRTDEIRERIAQRPWVRDVSISRIPTGTFRIRITAAQPMARIVDAQGRPGPFLDSDGRILPDHGTVAFNVPLVRGVTVNADSVAGQARHTLAELLHALADGEALTDALISEIHITGKRDVAVYLNPSAGQDAVKARLGSGNYAEKLKRLTSYWEQAVLPGRAKKIQEIDLRFDSQIVVRHSHAS